jgi:(1->4)-alpha-D-glucan 1-alpha-D-glucosylmutase
MEEKRISEEKVEEAFHHVLNHISDYRRIPVSTYRVQFNHRFKFSDAKSILPYLHELGISDIYASPYFKACKGSLHGYDILNHAHLNPEIGSEEEYNAFVEELKRHGMGQVLDIVPNHMSIAEEGNIFWMDVLENGPSSPYAGYFDIDWKPVKDGLENRVLLPVLGDQYGRILENQELQLAFEEGAFFILYHDRRFPVAPSSYKKVLGFQIETLEKRIESNHPHLLEFLSILTALDHLPPRTEIGWEKIIERRREKEVIKRRLWDLYHQSEDVRSFINDNVRIFNGDKQNPESFDLLDDLLNDQVYRLSHWRVATEEINYRRFFDINELAAIRMENPEVFKEAHRLIFRWIREGKVTALRVDHPDGLYHPMEYFYRLQRDCFIQFCLRSFPPPADEAAVAERIGQRYDEEISKNPSSPLRMPLYMVGEKILIKGERMPEDWPIFSTTGYVFLNSVNGIFIDMEEDKAFDDIYQRFIRSRVNYPDLIYEKKKLIMQVAMASEINMLGHALDRLSEKSRHTRDFTLNNLTRAIVEVIANFPVYRTYVTAAGANERDRRYIEQAVSRAKRKNPALSATVFDFLEDVLLLRYPENLSDADKIEGLDFAMKFQQITSPVMAKGVEDTAFYVFNRFVSLNEVGGYPERFGTPLDTFHGQNIERTKFWPCAMITTATHDSKRSEDVRARLNVLSEIPQEWRESVIRWGRMNRKKKSLIDGQGVPDRNEEYLLYQTLVGIWPMDPMSEAEYEIFKKRIRDYMLKAAREAKVNTSWISPNLAYEENLMKFSDAILSPSSSNFFLIDFENVQKKVSTCGMLNSLSQTLLKIAAPGIPDFYQGTELWDFSLVDPDNRRPVNFEIRSERLAELKKRTETAGSSLPEFSRDLVRQWRDGSIKLYITFKALRFRRENRLLFREGSYIPLVGSGDFKEHLCAFGRRRGEEVVLVVVPRFLTRLIRNPDEMPFGESVWGDSCLLIPTEISGRPFRNIFTGETLQTIEREGQGALRLGQLFAYFPVAMLEGIG